MLFASLSPESPPPENVRWRVELFGGLRAQRLDAAGAGQVVDSFRTQKTGALLAFLALDRRLHSREWLAEIMWPDSSIEAARNSLRVSLSWLRVALNESGKRGHILRTTREGIGAGEGLTSDLDEYRVELRRAELEKDETARMVALETALHRVTGQFLRGFYDDWALAAARRFEGEFLDVARRVIAAHEANGQWLRALDCARHAAMIVPESDIPLRDVVRLGLRAGESVGVKREFDAWKKRRERSGLSGTPEWHEFVTEVNSAHAASASAPSPPQGQSRAAAIWPSVPSAQQGSSKSADVEVQETSSPAPATPLALRPRSLPSATSSFVGRETEREQITAMLHAPDVRMVTILGAGGAGKTRLALEIARSTRDHDEFEAVAWVGASSLGSLRAVQNSMFDALGVPGVGSDGEALNKALEQSVLGQPSVSQRRTLIVFDNFEHLGEAGAIWLGELLERAPSVVVLVTSRLALSSASERLWILDPLPSTHTPDTPLVSTETALSRDSSQWPAAVRLFVDRAALVRPGFWPSASEVKDITVVCEALGGSPLAIEVAAARLALFSPSQLALQLQNSRSDGDGNSAPAPKHKAPTMRRSGLLLERVEEPEPPTPSEISPLDWPNRDVTAPARHRTLREAIEWSARQLPPKARQFWSRASVFRGAFDMNAASEVCQEPHAAALLLSLRDSSLLTLHTEGDVVRASWNDALREFAHGLLSPEERASLELRHATFFARRAREAGTIVGRGEGGRAFATFGADGAPPHSQREREGLRLQVRHAREELDAARADLRAAIEFFLTREPDVALDMGVHLWPAWAANKQLAEGNALLRRALGVAPPLSQDVPADATREPWTHAWEMRARALEGAGALAALSFEHHIARTFFDEARSAFERAGDADGVARALSAAGLVALQGGDLVAARALSEQSLSLESENHNTTRRNALFNLSLVAIMSGDLASVRALSSEGLALHRAQNDRHGIALCLEHLAQAALFEGEFATARVYFETARDQFQALDEDPGKARTWWGLGHVARKTGDLSEAYACFERSFEISGGLEHSWALPYQLEAFALLAGHRGDLVRTTRLLEGVRRIRREEAMPLPYPFFGAELDQLREQCRKELGPGRFEAECLVGESLTHEELVALVR